MKRILVFLFAILFLIFAFLGFRAASKLTPEKDNAVNSVQELQLEGTQRNYILIHVNDLTIEEPEIVSVWGMFVYYTQPPQLMFLPLYPVYDDTISKELYSGFKLDKDKSIDPRFIEEIEDRFQITTTGYVMVDNIGLSLFQQWLYNKEIQVSAANPKTADEKHLVLYNGQQFFKSLCSQWATKGAKEYINKVKWTELLPLHFSTDLSFESVALGSDFVKFSSIIEQCNVLSDE